MSDNNMNKSNGNNSYSANRTGADKGSLNNTGNTNKKSGEVYKAKPEDTTRSSNNKKNQEQNSSKKAAKTAAKAAGEYFAPGVGGKIVDMASKTKAGDKILNQAAKNIDKNPALRRAAKKLDEKGAIDAADKAVDVIGGSAGSSPSNTNTGSNSFGKSGGANNSGFGSRLGSGFGGMGSKPSFLDNNTNDSDEDNEKKNTSFSGSFFGSGYQKVVIFVFAPALLFLILFTSIFMLASGNLSEYEDALGISNSSGGNTGNLVFNTSDPQAAAFYERVNDVKQSFQQQGKSFNAVYIAGVYYVLKSNDISIPYKKMTTARIEEIANAMFNGNTFDKKTFKENLINNIFPSYISGLRNSKYASMADDVFSYVDNYISLVGDDSSGVCAASGTCIYNIASVSPEKGVNKSLNINVNNLKVRLLECGGNTPLAGEELIPFEDYVLGVAFGETSNNKSVEATKAMLVAARSYALVRPTAMGNGAGIKLAEENGQWILQLRNCVNDQVYCNPDTGCSTDGANCGVASSIYSGHAHAVKCLSGGKLASDDKMRSIANEVQGEVLVNKQGSIVNSAYTSTEQNKFTELASQGLDYKQILLQVYNNGNRDVAATDIKKMNCNSGGSTTCNVSTGPYASWKQCGASWSNIQLGNSGENICQIGCTATSVAMLIAKSGVATNVDGEFNPGTFVKKMSSIGGFSSGGGINWYAISSVAPNFQMASGTGIYILGWSKQEKLNKIKELLNQGYYLTVEVKGNTGQHWVAIDSVSGDNIIMMDPGSQATNLWSQYNWTNTSRIVYFKAS